MSEEKKHTYTAEDIHRYFSGEMTTSQMHAMEKAALNDTLLSEAMEGFNGLPSFTDEKKFSKLQKELNELKNRLTVKNTETRRYNSLGWKAAAAVLLLFGTVLALYIIKRSDNKQENNIANVTTTPVIKPGLDSTNIVAKKDTSTITNSLTATADSSKDIASNSTLKNSATAMATEEKKAAPIQLQRFNATQIDKQVDNNEESKLSNSFKSVEHIFSGKVTDADNNPIAYASLIINNNQQSKTDAKGMFNLTLTDSVIRLDVAANNFYPVTTKLTSNNFSSIKLTAIKHTLKKPFSDTFTTSTVQVLYKLGVEPKEGWEKYIYYLTQQLSNSQYDDGRHVTGEMVVSFEIDRLLQPVNFKFEKSIDDDVNYAVETLIFTGPEWKESFENGGLPRVVRLKIIF